MKISSGERSSALIRPDALGVVGLRAAVRASTMPGMDEPIWDDGTVWQRYDRAGTPISAERFVELARQPGYRFIRRTALLDAGDPQRTFRITTVWLGAVPHVPDERPPQIFETMVFGPGHHPFRPLHGRKYGTEPDAMIGHLEAAGKAARQLIDPVRVDLG